jgi:sterol 3beta-glucosyltransferase
MSTTARGSRAIAVHHGGAGTTYASLRAGLPTLICSVFADQPFWGVRCRALGVGDTFPFARFSTERLERSLRRLLDPAVKTRAKALAEQLAEEHGLDRMVELIERELPRARLAA